MVDVLDFYYKVAKEQREEVIQAFSLRYSSNIKDNGEILDSSDYCRSLMYVITNMITPTLSSIFHNL